MQKCWKTMTAWLVVSSLVGMAGCGSGEGEQSAESETPPVTAAIPGQTDVSAPQANQDRTPKKPAQDPLHPIVVLDTSEGKITLELDAENAPLTVDNFLHYVQSGFYDQTVFHEAVKGQLVLGGSYTTELVEKQARTPIRNEAHNGLKNVRGTIAMARRPDAIDSATCQFFFNLTDNSWLDFQDRTEEKYGYCVFGRVTKGLDVLEKISAAEVEETPDFPAKPLRTVLINSARRLR